jgi:hypothetical protein
LDYNKPVQQEQGTQITPSGTNSSGGGYSSPVPAELQGGWNWGAFFLTWIWGIGNSVWIALIALVPVPLASLAMGIILGIKGNEWAWQSRKWQSIEHFRKTQRVWLYWGIAAFCAPFVLILGIILIMVGLLGYYGHIRF